MEKLWTLSEVARYLHVHEQDVERLVAEGRLRGYRLAKQFLRFRPEEVQQLKAQGAVVASPDAVAVKPGGVWYMRCRDFVYFYDFYLLAFVVLAVLVIYLLSLSS